MHTLSPDTRCESVNKAQAAEEVAWAIPPPDSRGYQG